MSLNFFFQKRVPLLTWTMRRVHVGSRLRVERCGSHVVPSSSADFGIPEPGTKHSPVKTSSPSKTTYSDRFIPCRSSSRLQNFALVEMPSPAKEGGNDAYSRLLRSELFGAEVCSPSGQASPISPNKNLFRFKTDRSVPASPFHGSTSGNDVGVLGEVSTPPKAPRKIPKTPHKVRSRAQIHRRRRRKRN